METRLLNIRITDTPLPEFVNVISCAIEREPTTDISGNPQSRDDCETGNR